LSKDLSRTISTSIWQETPAADNPFFPEKSFCHGYDFYNVLLGRHSFPELVFLHFQGELPRPRELEHFNLLLTATMNSGPRSLENLAGMTAAVGGAPTGSALVSGMCASSGVLEGGAAVQAVMEMLQDLRGRHQGLLRKGLLLKMSYSRLAAGYEIDGKIPGFGTLFGARDKHAVRLAFLLEEKGLAGPNLRLLLKLERLVVPKRNEWVRLYAIAGASYLDLGFSPCAVHGLAMLAGGFGMLAFIEERYGQKWNEYPTWFDHGKYLLEEAK